MIKSQIERMPFGLVDKYEEKKPRIAEIFIVTDPRFYHLIKYVSLI